ncbi:MAG: DNA-3-methyladenine glycosylase I [Alphaproteobacteria bacterium]
MPGARKPGNDFAAVVDRAIVRAGGPRALEAMLPKPKTPAQLRRVADDRYLSLMCRRVFRAGLRHAMVDARWRAFEHAFHHFQPGRVVLMDDEALERMMADRRLIRHWAKLRSVRDNAAAVRSVADEHGTFGRYLAAWPTIDIVGLWRDLGRRCSQMGGNSGPAFLRMAGKDTFLLTGDVVTALVGLGACRRKPATKSELHAVQAAFNRWSERTGRPLSQISRILALSVG